VSPGVCEEGISTKVDENCQISAKDIASEYDNMHPKELKGADSS
jgi:hypothetical protein